MEPSKELENRIEKLYRCANTRQITEHLANITAGYVNNQEDFGGSRVSPAVGLSNELIFFFNDLKDVLAENRIEKLYRCANTRQITEHLANITAGYVNNQENLGESRVSPAVGLSNELIFFFNDLKEILGETRKNRVLSEAK